MKEGITMLILLQYLGKKNIILKMIKLSLLFFSIILILSTNFCLAQNIITFDGQGWNTDQQISSDFTIGNFKFSGSDKLFTNYGYNFNIYNTSIYFFFESATTDKITITILDNRPFGNKKALQHIK